ncbi:hypothetical protein BDV97DRAFT_53565 [Delphinella strobiligena]|nr:hypothetical protein BDV97DRAFT_53565 [Delphinella strobiligena]
MLYQMSTNSGSTSNSNHLHQVNESTAMNSSTPSASSALVYGNSGIPRRPSVQARQQSYTRSFPSDQPTGLSPATLSLAKEVLRSGRLEKSHCHASVFAGGLQWLLNSTAQTKPSLRSSQSRSQQTSLTEDVIQLFNAEHEGKERITEVANDTHNTEAWVANQSDHMDETSCSP